MAPMLEVSFNSPQCGWMSIGFSDGVNEFNTTTAHAPHESALGDLMNILTAICDPETGPNQYLLKWNRDPEEFDIRFIRDGDALTIEIYEYPTDERDLAERTLVFTHRGTVREVCSAFATTFEQLYEDRETDEFEFNWRQPFPIREYKDFKARVTTN